GDTYHHKQSLFLQYFEIQDMPSNPVKNKSAILAICQPNRRYEKQMGQRSYGGHAITNLNYTRLQRQHIAEFVQIFCVCDATAHKDCIPKSRDCRASPGIHGQFSGTSPFRPV
ncbi:hypothetical protein OS493_028994, partial [Desmophyllum pertusum]